MRVIIQRASQTGENKHNWKKNNHSQKERGSEKCVWEIDGGNEAFL